MHQAGVAVTKWGVEYEPTAAEAFKKNNPDAQVFCNNCNVLLRVSVQGTNITQFTPHPPTLIFLYRLFCTLLR